MLGGYPMESKQTNAAIYKCKMSATIDVTPFSSTASKTIPTCALFIPTFNGSFMDPCDVQQTNSNVHLPTDHDIIYHYLPKEFSHDYLIKQFQGSTVGRDYRLLQIISIKVV